MNIRGCIEALMLCACCSLYAQEGVNGFTMDKRWNVQFTSAKEVMEVRAVCASDSKEWNDCCFVWASGDYILKHSKNVEEMVRLAQEVPAIELRHPATIEFMNRKDAGTFLDRLSMLQALKKGDSFDAARDGLVASTKFPLRGLNENDFEKLKVALSSGVPVLQEAFLQRMPFVFRMNGCLKELVPLRSIIEQQVADSPLKQQVLDLYKKYEHLTVGKPAPLSVLKDKDGKEHTFAEFKGKVIVVDVWATWCCACLQKMPKFIQLKKEFEENKEVVFVAVSIDRSRSKQSWLKAIDKHGMQGLVNWMPDCSVMSAFESDYHIDSVPRSILIDQQGQIVTVFAPGPGEDLKRLILTTLNGK